MNIELLQRVRDHILEDPRRLNMHEWIINVSKKHANTWNHRYPPCGTIACIAGWTILLAYPEKKQEYISNPEQVAANILQIDDRQARELFYIGQWPVDYQKRYLGECTLKEMAQAAAGRIDLFIDKYTRKQPESAEGQN